MMSRWIVVFAFLAPTAQAQVFDELKGAYENSKNWLQENLNQKDAPAGEAAAEPKAAPAEPKTATEKSLPTEKARGPVQENPSRKTEIAAPKAPSKSWTRFLLLQHAEDQDVLMEVVEEINVGGMTLISNELNLGLYFGKNLLTTNLAFMYGSTSLEHEYIADNNVATEFEADHYAFAYGLRYSREVKEFIFPYLGPSRALFKSDISQKLKVRDDEDSFNFPLQSYDLKQFEMTMLALGVDARAHFWKVFTVGAGAGVEIPIQAQTPEFKSEEGTSNPEFQAAADELTRKLKQPSLHLNIHFGFAF